MTDPEPLRPDSAESSPPGAHPYAADLDLVRRALLRDTGAVQALVQHLSRVPAAVRVKNKRMGSPLSAEEEKDTAQEALTAIWAKLSTYAGRSKFDTWIFGFAATQVLKAVQNKARNRTTSDSGALEDERAPAPKEPALDPSVVHAAIDQLEPGSAEVVRLRHFEELSFDDIAQRLGLNLNTVKARYYRSMPKLQEVLLARWEDSRS